MWAVRRQGEGLLFAEYLFSTMTLLGHIREIGGC